MIILHFCYIRLNFKFFISIINNILIKNKVPRKYLYLYIKKLIQKFAISIFSARIFYKILIPIKDSIFKIKINFLVVADFVPIMLF